MRGLIAWLVPALCTAATWWLFLGRDDDDQYTVGQVVPVVLILIALGLVFGWLADRTLLLPIIVSSVVGLCAAVYVSWSDDESGLFMVGVFMIGVGAVIGSTLLVVLSWAVRQHLEQRRTNPPA